MAGDWIKVEKSTPSKPEVFGIAESLNLPPDQAFGLCFRFWCWCDDHLVSANAASVSKSSVDALVGRSGFADALISVGWLQVRNGSLEVPNFDRHLSQSAKTRALTASRVAKHTSRKTNDSSVSKPLAREEKRREEKKIGDKSPITPLPQVLEVPEFVEAWAIWKRHRTEIKHPLKPTMEAEQLKLLATWGPQRAVAAIRFTVSMGWQGLKEESATNNGGGYHKPKKDYTL